jgi:mannonate dehydratase
MRLALFYLRHEPHFLELAAQIGVSDIVSPAPQPEHGVHQLQPLLQLRETVEQAGLRLSVLESFPISDRIKLGLPGRDKDTDAYCRSLQNVGAAGIPIVFYNFMAVFNVVRTSTTTPTRGGALVTGFDHRLFRDKLLTEAGVVGEDEMWGNLEYFLKRIVPVAEESNVKLAAHPDDPPMSPLRGVARILSSVESLQRVIDLIPSDHNGITLCGGCVAEMGADVPDAIRHFGRQKKLFFAHFRNVKGSCPAFEESFHDDGDVNMAAVMRAYLDIAFDGPIRPDHVPLLAGEEGKAPGYTLLGRLHAIGYMRGLFHGLAMHA